MLKEQINFYTPKVFSVLRFFIRPARVWVIRYSVTAVLITDLRYINRRCTPPKFKNEDINAIIDLDKPNDFMCTADLKNGFFHIPVNSEHQELLGFSFEQKYYKWTVLPFDHYCSPSFSLRLYDQLYLI